MFGNIKLVVVSLFVVGPRMPTTFILSLLALKGTPSIPRNRNRMRKVFIHVAFAF